MGCELAQGFLFSKPVDVATAEKILASDRDVDLPKAKAAANND
jgi:EAL domain-containing protein (putative c-di-GMP-specific phosphodiesterase class I)